WFFSEKQWFFSEKQWFFSEKQWFFSEKQWFFSLEVYLCGSGTTSLRPRGHATVGNRRFPI
ncbi:MAG: hypothetical protein K2N13_10665, partial [Paraprevotella sp.]|nr:hypothetical protein [Paraprevotella sp.]